MENAGEKIYSLRTERNVSQEKLAQALNVSRPTISRWENDTVTPTTENIKHLCAFFGVDINYFLSDEEIAAIKSDPVEEIAVTETKKEPKFRTLKIVSAAVGMVLLALFVIACGIATYVIVMPVEGGQYVDVVDSVNYEGIIALVVGIIGLTVFVTLVAILIGKYIKNRKK